MFQSYNELLNIRNVNQINSKYEESIDHRCEQGTWI